MLDSFLIFAPLLLAPIVGLLRFVGCDLVFQLNEFELTSAAVNCGGPKIDAFERDDNPSGTNISTFESQGGEPVKLAPGLQVNDTAGNPASELYATARIGTNVKYTFKGLESGGYVATLKFAEIAGVQNPGGRVFAIGINAPPDTSRPFDILARAGGPLIAHDETLITTTVGSNVVIELTGITGQALVNAIEVVKRDAVAINPPQAIVFAGGTQEFAATPNFDSATFAWSVTGGSPLGQIGSTDQSTTYAAPSGISGPVSETVTVQATAGNSAAQANAAVSVYLRIDTTTRGAWVSKYGLDGYVLANTPPDTRLPSYVTDFDVRLTDGTPLNVASLGLQNNDPRVLTDPAGNPRPPFVWNDLNGTQGITISFRFLDSDPHLFGVYCLDNGPDRRQRFTVTQLDSGITETVDSAIGTGTYFFWIGSGRIQIDVVKVPGSIGINNVVNAIFFR